jgi:hypothetical protein
MKTYAQIDFTEARIIEPGVVTVFRRSFVPRWLVRFLVPEIRVHWWTFEGNIEEVSC